MFWFFTGRLTNQNIRSLSNWSRTIENRCAQWIGNRMDYYQWLMTLFVIFISLFQCAAIDNFHHHHYKYINKFDCTTAASYSLDKQRRHRLAICFCVSACVCAVLFRMKMNYTVNARDAFQVYHSSILVLDSCIANAEEHARTHAQVTSRWSLDSHKQWAACACVLPFLLTVWVHVVPEDVQVHTSSVYCVTLCGWLYCCVFMAVVLLRYGLCTLVGSIGCSTKSTAYGWSYFDYTSFHCERFYSYLKWRLYVLLFRMKIDEKKKLNTK